MHLAREAIRAALCDATSVCAVLGLTDGALPQRNGQMIHCPWHDDRTPSCSVTSAADGGLRVRCFACGVSGDAFTLIAQVRGLDVKTQFPMVLDAAAEVALELETGDASAPKPEVSATTQPAVPVKVFDAMARTMLAAAPLAASPGVTGYLSARGLLQQATSHGWGALPSERKALQSVISAVVAAVGADVWARSGMANDSGTLKYPANVIVIPWRDREGHITTLQRRTLTTDRAPKYVFPAARFPSEPYGAENGATSDATTEVAFVEGAVDALAYADLCERHGKKRLVLGLPGVSSWRSAWDSYVKGRLVHLAFDADDAGDRGALVLRDRMYAAGAMRVLRQRPRHAKDWAELLVHEGP